jgi:peptide/nickel transport system substrate-binding protein
VKGFSPWLIGTTGGGARSLYEIFTNGLVSTDAVGNLEPRLAAKLPSFDDGSIVILPDGRMQTTWKMRSGVKWHDGAAFTADDLAFSFEVNSHPDIPGVQSSSVVPQIDSLDASDPETLRIVWKTTYYRALNLGFVEFWPYPKHLLGAAFQGDKEAFLNLPYWTTEHVHLGAYRVADFGLGEQVTLERFDDYFRGRPKVDTIVIRIIPDPNTMYSNVLAGTVDIVTETTLPIELFARLRDEWQRTGGGKVVQRDGNWFFLNVQYNPDYGKLAPLRQDVRARRGLLVALDRDALRAVTLPGFADTEADSFMPLGDPRAAAVGKPFARYRYDSALALRELADAGWGKGADGQMIDAAGEASEIPIRTTGSNTREMEVVAQTWRDLGFRVTEEPVPGNLTSDRPYRATFPGVEITAQMNGDQILPRFDGRLCPRPPRFAGSQGGCYTNPELDRLIDKLYATLDIGQQGQVLKDVGELFATEVVMLPLYFAVNLAAVRKEVQALDDFAGAPMGSSAQISRNAHLWDRG